jgi:hypothetical protein
VDHSRLRLLSTVDLSLPTRSSGLSRASAQIFEGQAARSLAQIRSRDFDGPRTSPALARAFLQETLIHSHDVAALSRALGVQASRHDLLELRPIDEVKRLRDAMNEGQIEGIPAGGAPRWLSRMISDAQQAGEKTLDVGKLNPYVTAGLAITRRPRELGPDYIASLAVHRLAEHHVKRGPEMAADVVNSIRMPRVYRPFAMSFAATHALARAKAVDEGWSPEERALLDRAVDLQRKLERSGAITPHHDVEQRSTGDGWDAHLSRGPAYATRRLAGDLSVLPAVERALK